MLLVGVGSHHFCCVLRAAGVLFTLRLLSHTHPVSKLSGNGCNCPFKHNSRETGKVHPPHSRAVSLGRMLNSSYTLLPPGSAGKVTSELVPKWFLQPGHVDEAVGYFYWPKLIPSVITFVPSCHTSLLLHVL